MKKTCIILLFGVVILFIFYMCATRRENFHIPLIGGVDVGPVDLPSLVRDGKKIMKESRVVITGLVRDSAHFLPTSLTRLEKICSMTRDCKVVILENDSEDSTRESLLLWRRQMREENIDVTILGCGENALSCSLSLPRSDKDNHPNHIERIKKMAYLRNMCLDYILERYGDWDYLLVVDLDLEGEMALDGLATSFAYMKSKSKIDGICASGIIRDEDRFYRGAGQLHRQYDSFAYIEKGQKIEFRQEGEIDTHNDYIWRTIPPEPLTPLRRVASCFGGAMLYRMSSLYNKRPRYDYSRDPNMTSCEHAHLHKNLKIYHNPAMIFRVDTH